MAAFNGEVLYRAGQESDTSDIWDDTALIQAYDRAVNIMKSGNFKNSEGCKDKCSAKNRKQQNSKENGCRKKEKGKNRGSSSQWHVGDNCSAVFSEDGETYNARIISLDRQKGTCVVEYDRYGNVEEQFLKDIMRPSVEKSNKIAKDFEQGYYAVDSPYNAPKRDIETGMEWSSQTPSYSNDQWRVSDICLAPEYPSGHWHEAVINSFSTPYTCQVTFLRSRKSQQVDRSQLYQSNSSQYSHHQPHYIPPASPQWHPDGHVQWPRHQPHMTSHFPSYSFSHPRPPVTLPHPGMLPPFPPSIRVPSPTPPMPPVPPHPMINTTGEQDEPLASMLMSWYLSGYYTGYYQGLQGARQRPMDNSNCQEQPDTTNKQGSEQCTEQQAPVNKA